ncbi:hypothetical protein BC332_26674 [Capsicum chinense]|nr:hypothetical protein BC332_26674 [Capsicum chinense]
MQPRPVVAGNAPCCDACCSPEFASALEEEKEGEGKRRLVGGMGVVLIDTRKRVGSSPTLKGFRPRMKYSQCTIQRRLIANLRTLTIFNKLTIEDSVRKELEYSNNELEKLTIFNNKLGFGFKKALLDPRLLEAERLKKKSSPLTDEEKKEMSLVPYSYAVGSLMYAMVCWIRKTGEEHLKVWGKGCCVLTLSPGIHHSAMTVFTSHVPFGPIRLILLNKSKPRKSPTIEALTVKPDGEEPLFRINTERKVNSPRAYSFKERIPIPRTLLSYLAALSVRGSLLYS